MANDNALDFIDKAVSKWVGLVVLNGGEGSGGRVYEAALSLKAVVKDRAYLLIAERVDIAAAVGASGVVLSDQGGFFAAAFFLLKFAYLRLLDYSSKSGFISFEKLIRV